MQVMNFKSFVIGLVAVFVLTGCAAQPEDSPKETVPATVETGIGDSGTSEPVVFKTKDGKMVCPMMGVEMKDESEAVGYVDHEGTRYYMCCDACLKMGKDDPAKVAEKAAGM